MVGAQAVDARARGRPAGELGLVAVIIHVHGTPAPQGSKRHVGNGVMIESSKAVKPWREAVKWAALGALTQARDPEEVWAPTAPVIVPRYPLTGPLCVDATFTFPRPKHHYRTGRNAHLLRDGAPVAPAGKPDIDKLIRSTFDALTDAAVWRDDSQVVSVTAVKTYGEAAGATLSIEAA